MQTGLEIINEIQRRLGRRVSSSLEGPTGELAETKQILLLLNRVLKNLNAADDWPMLHTDGTIMTNAPVTGTDVRLDLANGSDTVTISSFDVSGTGSVQLTPFLLSHLSWAIQIGSGTPVYRIAEIISPTEIKLNRPWIGDSNAPTGSDDDTLYDFIMAMDQYALPEDFDRPLGEWTDFLSTYHVNPLGPADFKKERQKENTDIITGDPMYFTVYGMDPNNTYQVIHFHPFPAQETMMEYSYIRLHPEVKNDADLILYPDPQVGVIIEAVLYLANRDYEDDQRLNDALQEFVRQFDVTVGKRTMVSNLMMIQPKVSRMRSTRSAGRLKIDYGEFWDRYDKGKLP